MPEAVDWLKSTLEDRAALFVACKRVVDETGLTWEAFLRSATANPPAGADYIANFRKGKISRKRANEIFRWLKERHPQHALALKSQLAPLSPKDYRTKRYFRTQTNQLDPFGGGRIEERHPNLRDDEN